MTWARVIFRFIPGRPHTDPEDGPVLLCTDPSLARDRFAATEVRDLMLDLVGVPAPARSTPL